MHKLETNLMIGTAEKYDHQAKYYFRFVLKSGPYEHLCSMVQNKMATARLGFKLSALTTIPERADVRHGTWAMGRARNERDPAQTPSAKGGPTGSY